MRTFQDITFDQTDASESTVCWNKRRQFVVVCVPQNCWMWRNSLFLDTFWVWKPWNNKSIPFLITNIYVKYCYGYSKFIRSWQFCSWIQPVVVLKPDRFKWTLSHLAALKSNKSHNLSSQHTIKKIISHIPVAISTLKLFCSILGSHKCSILLRQWLQNGQYSFYWTTLLVVKQTQQQHMLHSFHFSTWTPLTNTIKSLLQLSEARPHVYRIICLMSLNHQWFSTLFLH